MRETLRHRAFEGPLERAVRVFEVHYRRVPGVHWQTKWHSKKVFSGLTGRKFGCHFSFHRQLLVIDATKW